MSLDVVSKFKAWWTRALACAALVLVLLPALGVAAPPPAALLLDDTQTAIEAWPAMTLLSDPGQAWDLADVKARASQFRPPDTAYANLGVRADAVWLRLSVTVPQRQQGPWLLNINYPSISRIDVYLLRDGATLQHALLGEQVPFNQRTLPARSHAMPLALEAGGHYEIYLRVVSSSSLVLPITLVKEGRFHTDEARIQLIQGVLTGVGLCLIVYSLAQWVSVRDQVFVHYSAVVFGTTLFFFVHFGLAQQHLWPDMSLLNLSPAGALIAEVGGFLFTERVLGIRAINPRRGQAMVLGSMLAAAATLAFVAGVISYRTAQLAATLLGPWPFFLALPTAFAQARRGEAVARYVFVGWTVFALSTIEFVGLLRGFVPANAWSRHFFQFGAIFEMCVWMRVLGLRSAEMRSAARRFNAERDAMQRLANTDALTSLPNRRGLSEAAQAALKAIVPGKSLVLYMLDLDGFKAINDHHGHDAGDELLVAVAARLRAAVRASDLVARLGGDEFVVMAEGLAGEGEAQRLGQKLLNEFQRDFEINGHRCHVGLTIGYALAPQDGDDITSLLKRADAAMYSGKQAGRHCMRRAEVGLVEV